MSDQQIVFKVVLDDSGVPAAAGRTSRGIQDVGAAAGKSSGAMLKFAADGKASAAQLQALSYQTTDIVTSLAGGQSPLLVLLQQGGQLRDQFGGVGNVFKAVASVATPTAVAVTGVALAVTALAVAAYQGYTETSKLTKELALSGNAAGVTRGQINLMAADLAAASGTGIGTAREAMAALATSGAFVGSTLEVAGRAVVAVQRLSGQATEEIVKGFGGMRNGVATWAAESNRAYNFLNAAQFRHIRALEAQGRQQEAMRYALGELASTMETRAVPALGSLERAINGVKAAGSGFWDWVKGIGRDETPEEKLARVASALDQLKQKLPSDRFFDLSGNQVASKSAAEKAIRDEQGYLQELVRMNRRGAEAKAEEAQKNQREILELSDANQTALLGVESATQAKLLAEQTRGAQARSLAADQAHRERLISDQQYTAEVIAVERQRIAAELQAAQASLAIANRRGGDKPEQKSANRAAVIAAETQIVNILAKRDALEARIGAQEFNQEAVKLNQALAAAGQAYWQALSDQREQTRALARETTEYSFALQQLTDLQALANGRDLDGRRQGDQARQQADRMAALADQYNAEKQRLDAELRGSRITREVHADRLQRLRQYYDSALDEEQRYQDRRARLEADASVGFDRALNTYLEASRNVASQTEQMWSGVFSGLEDGLVRFAVTGKASFGDLARSVVADLIRIQLRAQLAGIFGELGKFFGFSGSSIGAVNGSAGTASLSAFAAHGMAFDGVQAFAAGGIVNRPTLFRFAQGGAMRNGLMGEAGPEAIMPLRRGADGNLGVLASGASQQPLQLNLQVINNTGTPVKATATQRGNGDMELLLEAVDQGMAERVSSGRAATGMALQQRFGLQPAMG